MTVTEQYYKQLSWISDQSCCHLDCQVQSRSTEVATPNHQSLSHCIPSSQVNKPPRGSPNISHGWGSTSILIMTEWLHLFQLRTLIPGGHPQRILTWCQTLFTPWKTTQYSSYTAHIIAHGLQDTRRTPLRKHPGHRGVSLFQINKTYVDCFGKLELCVSGAHQDCG